jgi:two-component system OmpR family response regulator
MACALVVDDDARVRHMVDLALRYRGHEVYTADDGAGALELAGQKHPDVIVLDVVLPDMDGFQVCQKLRADPDMHSVPIIFLTAKDQLPDKVEGFEIGGNDYLTKPFHLKELELRVEALLRRSQSPQKSSPSHLRVGVLSLNLHTFTVRVGDGEEALLTPVEFQLLEHLMRHSGQVVSVQKMLEEVWDYYPGTGDPALVRMYVRKVRGKIEPNPTEPIFLQSVPRHGYIVRQVKELPA